MGMPWRSGGIFLRVASALHSELATSRVSGWHYDPSVGTSMSLR